MNRPDSPILVVDDDDNTRTGLAALLRLRSYAVVTAANGAEALLQAREHRPCLILLDLMMPLMDGEQFRAAQLEDEGIKDIPVLILSAKSDCVSAAKRLGALGCLAKPISLRDVVDRVAAHCVLLSKS